ncbi:DUF6691 family protein [Dickeya zeae]|uniref:YeeE/YedE family protein n=1 Tax=Dickeya zeae TaxID=204042 RepID=A0ABX8W2A2_9GAMM|nr:DUF6691 family protein [Dickeya zeae]QYM94150.1 hypothetical protein FGI21_20930 [Dickeya zeae]
MTLLVSFFSGLIFGLGLLISGMANPEKVLGFLNLSAAWDPSLLFVMVGAIAVGIVGFSLAKRRKTALLGMDMALPKSKTIDGPLIIGALLFGAGWGIAGICPGPALVLVGAGYTKGMLFTLAMLGGMGFAGLLKRS